MEGTPTNEELRSRFRELAAEFDRIHDEWQVAAGRDDVGYETRLIARETNLLAEVDKIVQEFRARLSLPRR